MGVGYGVAVRYRDNYGGGGCFLFVVGYLYGYVVPCGTGVSDDSGREGAVRLAAANAYLFD